MRISIIFAGSPLKAYLDNKKAIKEYERLRDMDDYIDYSVMELPIEDAPHNKPDSPDKEATVYGFKWEDVIKECENILQINGHAESPSMCNLPNVIRDLVYKLCGSPTASQQNNSPDAETLCPGGIYYIEYLDIDTVRLTPSR